MRVLAKLAIFSDEASGMQQQLQLGRTIVMLVASRGGARLLPHDVLVHLDENAGTTTKRSGNYTSSSKTCPPMSSKTPRAKTVFALLGLSRRSTAR